MRRSIVAFGMLALAVGVGAVSAQAEGFSTTPITHFTESNVSAVLTKMGAANVTTGKIKSGETVIHFDVNGASHTAIIVACPKDKPGCLGLYLGVPVKLETGTFNFETINSFNDALPFGKAVRSDDGTMVVMFRYIISDGGISEENLATNVAVFTAMPAVFVKYLSSKVVASAQPKESVFKQVSAPTPSMHSEFDARLGYFAEQKPIVLPH